MIRTERATESRKTPTKPFINSQIWRNWQFKVKTECWNREKGLVFRPISAICRNKGGMDQQTYLDLITALNIIQDVRSSPEQRQSAENAVSAFGEVPNAISYIYYILGTNSERILLFAYVVTK